MIPLFLTPPNRLISREISIFFRCRRCYLLEVLLGILSEVITCKLFLTLNPSEFLIVLLKPLVYRLAICVEHIILQFFFLPLFLLEIPTNLFLVCEEIFLLVKLPLYPSLRLVLLFHHFEIVLHLSLSNFLFLLIRPIESSNRFT